VPGFLRDAIDQLKLGDPAPFVTPLLPAAENAVEVPEVGPQHAHDSESLEWRALLDSNQWPSASETCEACFRKSKLPDPQEAMVRRGPCWYGGA